MEAAADVVAPSKLDVGAAALRGGRGYSSCEAAPGPRPGTCPVAGTEGRSIQGRGRVPRFRLADSRLAQQHSQDPSALTRV